MPSYFCYERDFAGRFQPAVYHNEKPLAKSANGAGPERTQLHEIGAEFLGEDGISPSFGALQQKYPIGGN